MEQKLVVVVMGQNCEKFISMCLESVKDADVIIYCDGGSEDNTLMIANSHRTSHIIYNKYDQEDKGMNGKQRNFYLNYLKENYKDCWILCLDADEVVDTNGINKIKDFINILPQENSDILFSIKMRHFIQDLGHEDATQQVHFVPHRLFKIRKDLFYPEEEHPILQSNKEFRSGNLNVTTIWHLSYIPNLWEYKKKYENHLKKSEIHSKEYLNNWYRTHIFGGYPKKQIDIRDIPEVILNEFGINKDELYFADRMQLETKHFVMMQNWLHGFDANKVLDIGCGIGHYGKAGMIMYDDLDYTGIDISKWAIENTPYKELNLLQQDITKDILFLTDTNYDLVLCIDILEHLSYDKLDFVLDRISKLGKNFIFSLPYLGSPDLEGDKTHIIKEKKEWWVEKLNKFFKISDVPEHWFYSHQLLIGERK